MRRIPDATRWQPARRHRAWVRGLRLGAVGRRETGAGLTLRYRNFGRRPAATSLAFALNLSVMVRTSIRNLVGQRRTRPHQAPAAGAVTGVVLSSLRRSDAHRGEWRGSVAGPSMVLSSLRWMKTPGDEWRGSLSGPGVSAALPAPSSRHQQAPAGVVPALRTREEVRIAGASRVPESPQKASGLTSGPAGRSDGPLPGAYPDLPESGRPERERMTIGNRVLKIGRAAPGSVPKLRLRSVHREQPLLPRHTILSAARRLDPVSVRSGDPERGGRVMGRRPARIDEPNRVAGERPVRQSAARDNRESAHDRAGIRPLIVRRPARAAGLQAGHPVREPLPLVVRKRSVTGAAGIQRPSAPEERELRQRIVETVERTVVEVVDRRLKPDSRLSRRLTGQMRTQLYQDLVFERERLGVT